MNRPKSPCLGTCGPYSWYEAELELYNEFVKAQKRTDRIDYPDGQMKRMRGWK